jgi:hypothetical protein
MTGGGNLPKRASGSGRDIAKCVPNLLKEHMACAAEGK